MLNLYYNYYKHDNIERNKELNYCFEQNLSSNYDNIFILSNENINLDTIFVSKKPKYNEFINIINQNSKSDDINIILNSDCYFDSSSLEKIKNNIKDNEFWCVSRRDILSINPFLTSNLIRPYESQDCWIFKGFVNFDIDFALGTPGCDNKISYMFYNNGYNVINPSLDLNLYHYHITNLRNYSKEQALLRPYLLVDPVFSFQKESKKIILK